jgi:carbon-monoxide dehydrogenase small subunit
METTEVCITVDGAEVNDTIEPRLLLAHFLRERAGRSTVRIGCDTTSCGACTVLLDGANIKSCTMFAVQAAGRAVTTLQGLVNPDGSLHPLQEAFREAHALQCGYCTPGVILAAVPLVNDPPDPLTDEEIKQAISGNLCRCTGYVNIVEAIRLAAARQAPA